MHLTSCPGVRLDTMCAGKVVRIIHNINFNDFRKFPLSRATKLNSSHWFYNVSTDTLLYLFSTCEIIYNQIRQHYSSSIVLIHTHTHTHSNTFMLRCPFNNKKKTHHRTTTHMCSEDNHAHVQ